MNPDTLRIAIPGFVLTGDTAACDTAGAGPQRATVLALHEFLGERRRVLLPPARRLDQRTGRVVLAQPRRDSTDAAHFWTAADTSSQEVIGSLGSYLFLVSRFVSDTGPRPPASWEFGVVEVGRGAVELLTAPELAMAGQAAGRAAADPAPDGTGILRIQPRYESGRLVLRYLVARGDCAACRAGRWHDSTGVVEVRAAEVPAALRAFLNLPGTVRSYVQEVLRPDSSWGWSRVDAAPTMRWALLEEFVLAPVRGEELSVGESDYLIWKAVRDSGYSTSLVRGAGDRYRQLGSITGIWVAAEATVWRLGAATFRVPPKPPRCDG